MKKYIFLFLTIFTILWGNDKRTPSNYLIVLSMDGFRWDYTQKCETPNFDSIANKGVSSIIIPSFPSKTFPNHYTLASGLYPDNHGLILNDFYDYSIEKWYHVSNRETVEDGSFYGGEPIWNTAERQGVKTATLFWVGSEAEINGLQPTYWKKYQHNMPFGDRIDTVITWLEKPKQNRPKLIMWYLHEPDSWGHKLGPENNQINSKIHYLDSLVGVFSRKLSSLPIKDSINVIITSDHGMGNIDIEKVVVIDDFIKKNWLKQNIGSNPIYMFEPKAKYLDSVYVNLQKANHLRSWKKSEIPDYLHFGKNQNIMPIVAVADSGWSIMWKDEIKSTPYLGGTHGYDPTNKDMHAIFMAYGPDFKSNIHHHAFENIHLYSLMAKLLHIDESPNDGDINELIDILKK